MPLTLIHSWYADRTCLMVVRFSGGIMKPCNIELTFRINFWRALCFARRFGSAVRLRELSFRETSEIGQGPNFLSAFERCPL